MKRATASVPPPAPQGTTIVKRRGEEQRRPLEVPGLAPAAHRRPAEDSRLPRRVGAQPLGQRRPDPARRKRVHPDPVRRVGDGERLRHLHDAALARGVAGHESAAEEGEHRGDVDDRAAAPGEERAGRGADPHRARQVDVHHLGEDLGLQLGAAADDAGRVDDDVEPRLVPDQVRHRRCVAHVERCDGHAVRRTLYAGQPRRHHLGAGCREGPGDARADARGAADDEGPAPGEERLRPVRRRAHRTNRSTKPPPSPTSS
jgi:hypothetical protein